MILQHHWQVYCIGCHHLSQHIAVQVAATALIPHHHVSAVVDRTGDIKPLVPSPLDGVNVYRIALALTAAGCVGSLDRLAVDVVYTATVAAVGDQELG